MPGFVSSFSNNEDCVFAANADFTGDAVPSTTNGLQTNGKMWIGSTVPNANGTHINVGTLTSPDSSVTIGYSSPNITLQVPASGTTCLFSAYTSASYNNVTGDGTLYTVIFDTAIVNTGGAYNTATGVFTAPTTGNYLFNCTLDLNGFTVAHTDFMGLFEGSSPESRFIRINPGVVAANGDVLHLSGSFLVRMTAGQQQYVNVQVSGGAKVVNVKDFYCKFSGYLIP